MNRENIPTLQIPSEISKTITAFPTRKIPNMSFNSIPKPINSGSLSQRSHDTKTYKIFLNPSTCRQTLSKGSTSSENPLGKYQVKTSSIFL